MNAQVSMKFALVVEPVRALDTRQPGRLAVSCCCVINAGDSLGIGLIRLISIENFVTLAPILTKSGKVTNQKVGQRETKSLNDRNMQHCIHAQIALSASRRRLM